MGWEDERGLPVGVGVVGLLGVVDLAAVGYLAGQGGPPRLLRRSYVDGVAENLVGSVGVEGR